MDVLRLALSSDEGAERAFDHYWRQNLGRYNVKSPYEGDAEVWITDICCRNTSEAIRSLLVVPVSKLCPSGTSTRPSLLQGGNKEHRCLGARCGCWGEWTLLWKIDSICTYGRFTVLAACTLILDSPTESRVLGDRCMAIIDFTAHAFNISIW